MIDYRLGLAIGLPLGLGLAALGSGIGMGRAIAAALESTARQPEMSTKLLVLMIIGCALIETLTIYALIFAFTMSGKLS
jgi:F-type H+-transporting ATPase subunit c